MGSHSSAYQCFTERYRYIGRVHYNYSTVIALHINIDVLKLVSMNHMYNNTEKISQVNLTSASSLFLLFFVPLPENPNSHLHVCSPLVSRFLATSFPVK